MGLTIHWRLQSPKGATEEDVKDILTILQKEARKIGCEEINEIVTLQGKEVEYPLRFADRNDENDPHIWIKIGARMHKKPEQWPLAIHSLTVWPGEGCETADFTFCLYQGEKGWTAGGFCKTQYANEKGIEHFLKCHLRVIYLLDCLKAMGWVKSVNDEGEYWQKRDKAALAKEVGEWDNFIAAFGGMLKDQIGGSLQVDAPIFSRPDFEVLEFKGLVKLSKLIGEVER